MSLEILCQNSPPQGMVSGLPTSELPPQWAILRWGILTFTSEDPDPETLTEWKSESVSDESWRKSVDHGGYLLIMEVICRGVADRCQRPFTHIKRNGWRNYILVLRASGI